jgi:hypothetical protein
MSNARIVVATTLALALAGCQRSSGPMPPPQAEASFETLQADGDARLRERDWEGAVRAYEAALARNPASLPVRYGLGVAQAQLDRREQATAAFGWVVEHGPADRDEVRMARQWLTDAGVFKTRVVAEAAPSETRVAPTAVPGGGLLQGRTEWPGLDPNRSRPNVQILLEGDDSSTRGLRYMAKAALNDPYRIEKVMPGHYRVLAQVGPTRVWETAVAIRADTPTVLDLTQATAIARPSALGGSDR